MAGIPPSVQAALADPLIGAQAATLMSYHPGEWMYERIARSIVEFEKSLDPSKEIGARLISFGPNEVINIDDVGYWGTDLIRFYGRNSEGHKVQLLQHITQVNVLLVAAPAQTDPPKRIGFILEAELNELKKPKDEAR
jgi:hypothetical protein